MANVDFPMGYKPVATTHGGPPRQSTYKSDGSAIIYPGDLIRKDGSGRVLTMTAATTTPFAVAASYAAAVAGTEIQAYDDLVNTEFEVQVDDATLADDTVIGNYYDTTVTTGDTVRLRSTQELNGDASDEDTLRVLRLATRPDNVWGLNANVIVQIRATEMAPVVANT